jgi:hypothetical protein
VASASGSSSTLHAAAMRPSTNTTGAALFAESKRATSSRKRGDRRSLTSGSLGGSATTLLFERRTLELVDARRASATFPLPLSEISSNSSSCGHRALHALGPCRSTFRAAALPVVSTYAREAAARGLRLPYGGEVESDTHPVERTVAATAGSAQHRPGGLPLP